MNYLVLFLTAFALLANIMLNAGLRSVFIIPALCVLSLASLLSWFPARRIGVPSRIIPCLTAGGVFFTYLSLRAVFSPIEYVARPDLFLVLAATILYLLVALNITAPRHRAIFVCVLLVMAAANCLIGAVQFFKGGDFMPFEFLPRGDYGTRASGFYGCPNHLAGFLEVALLMALGLTFWSRWRLPGKILAGYVALVCAAGILMTGSRGGYASTLAGVLVFAFLSLVVAGKRLRVSVWYVLLPAIVAVVCTVGFAVRSVVQGSDILHYRVEALGTDARFRIALSRAAVKQFQLSPIVGTGSGTYLYYGRQFREPGVHKDPIYAHNDCAQLLAEYGLVGASSFLLFLVFHLRSGWKVLAGAISGKWNSFERSERVFMGSNTLALTVGAVSSVAAYVVHSFVDFNLHIPANALLMAFIFGLLANPAPAPSMRPQEPAEITWPPSRFLRLLLPGIGIWLACAALPTWRAEYYADKAKAFLSDGRCIDSPDIAQAAADYALSALQDDPQNPYLYYYIGEAKVTLAEMTDTEPAKRERLFAESIATYKQALELTPQDVNLFLRLGWSLDALKRIDESEAVYRRALELDPNSGPVHWEYAAHLHRLGKLDEAEAEYIRSLELGVAEPGHLGLQRINEEKKAKQSGASDPPSLPN